MWCQSNGEYILFELASVAPYKNARHDHTQARHKRLEYCIAIVQLEPKDTTSRCSNTQIPYQRAPFVLA